MNNVRWIFLEVLPFLLQFFYQTFFLYKMKLELEVAMIFKKEKIKKEVKF